MTFASHIALLHLCCITVLSGCTQTPTCPCGGNPKLMYRGEGLTTFTDIPVQEYTGGPAEQPLLVCVDCGYYFYYEAWNRESAETDGFVVVLDRLVAAVALPPAESRVSKPLYTQQLSPPGDWLCDSISYDTSMEYPRVVSQVREYFNAQNREVKGTWESKSTKNQRIIKFRGKKGSKYVEAEIFERLNAPQVCVVITVLKDENPRFSR